MEAFKPNEETEQLKSEIERQAEVIQEQRTEIEELKEYKRKYTELKKLFDQLEKDQHYRSNDLRLTQKEASIKLANMEAQKDHEIRSLKEELDRVRFKAEEAFELVEKARTHGACLDPESCRNVNCYC